MYYSEEDFSFNERLLLYIKIIYLLFFKEKLIHNINTISTNGNCFNMRNEIFP